MVSERQCKINFALLTLQRKAEIAPSMWTCTTLTGHPMNRSRPTQRGPR